jgi:hypothetical protein
MTIDPDAWLEHPYIVEAIEAARVEAWEESDDYSTALAEWATGDPDVQQAFAATAAYATALEAWVAT